MIILFFLSLFVSVSFASNLSTCAGETSEKERRETLAYHNDLRSTIAIGNYIEGQNMSMPSASNMLQLEWSCDLENSAQEVANRCEFKHHEDSSKYGENLFMVTTEHLLRKDDIMVRAAHVWEREFLKYGWNGLTLTHKLFMTGIGHATQMAWAGTRYIGCGSALCKNGFAVHIVCHYEPRGNIIGENIYEYGDTCNNCPDYSSCDSKTGLCVFVPSNL